VSRENAGPNRVPSGSQRGPEEVLLGPFGSFLGPDGSGWVRGWGEEETGERN
jgi:hypothetical protein